MAPDPALHPKLLGDRHAPGPSPTQVRAAAVAFVAAVALVVAAFLPWLKSGGEAVIGWDLTGDAQVLFAAGLLAIVVGGLLVAGYGRAWTRLALLAGAVLCAAYAAVDIADVRSGDLRRLAGQAVQVGAGLWIVAAVAVVLLVGAALPVAPKGARPGH